MLHGAVLRSPLAHARIVSIDTSAALAAPQGARGASPAPTSRSAAWRGCRRCRATRRRCWRPTRSASRARRSRSSIADDRYSARDALELIDVEYEPLPVVVDARRALDPDAPVIRDDQARSSPTTTSSTGRPATRRDRRRLRGRRRGRRAGDGLPALASGADGDLRRDRGLRPGRGKLTIWCTTQAPARAPDVVRAITGLARAQDPRDLARRRRRLRQQGAGLPGLRVRDRRGAMLTGRPVKWMEDRSENLMSTGLRARLRDARRDRRDRATGGSWRSGSTSGRPRRVQRHRTADAAIRPASSACSPAPTTSRPRTAASPASTPTRRRAASPTRARSGSPRPSTSSSGSSTAWRGELGDRPGRAAPAQPACAPTSSRTRARPGGSTTPGDYERALRKALELAGYDELRREQAEKRARGELMGIGVAFFTEAVGAGPRKHMDILGLGMNDGATLRISPTGKAQLAISVQTQGQGHETTFAQIVAEELGIPPEDIDVVHGDTDTTPYGLGTYGSRSTPVSGAATALVARKVRERARIVASAMLEVAPEDLEWKKAAAGPLVGEGRPRAGRDDPGDRDGGARGDRAARGRRGRARRRGRLRPAEPDVPVRRLRLRRRHRPGHRRRSRSGASSPSTTAACGSTR